MPPTADAAAQIEYGEGSSEPVAMLKEFLKDNQFCCASQSSKGALIVHKFRNTHRFAATATDLIAQIINLRLYLKRQ